MDYSFSRPHRLKTREQFLKVLRNGRKYSTGYIVLYVLANDLHVPRLGITVAKRNVKRAVDRNRIKRLIRENFRTHKHLVLNCDIVFRVFKQANAISNEELQQCVEKLLRKSAPQ